MEVQSDNMSTASVIFNIEELWLLQACIRHEIQQAEQWHNPPASLDLNDDIANAIVFCLENDAPEAAIVLDRAKCLAVDYCVRQDLKSPNGVPVGRNILLKSFLARREIAEGNMPISPEPAQPSALEVREQLRHLEQE
jgi:hypothetical protein